MVSTRGHLGPWFGVSGEVTSGWEHGGAKVLTPWWPGAVRQEEAGVPIFPTSPPPPITASTTGWRQRLNGMRSRLEHGDR